MGAPLPDDLFTQAETAAKGKHVYTVSEITQDIRLILENTFAQVWIEGEISNARPSAAGHVYLSLKDEGALLQAVIFSRAAKEIKFKFEDGLKVVCFGNIEVYGPHGKYQLIIEKVEPKGIGSLQLALEQLKKKLEKEGLFAAERKRPIPFLPERVGLVTSAQGAAIKDILKVLETRFKDIHIVINPVKVQGQGAEEEIAQAIEEFNRFNEAVAQQDQIEVMIVGRGGGSIEDLWSFNAEVVARAIYASRIPVIAAVGHERDWTIADLVADVRAPTPSAAAEMVIPRKEDVREKVNALVEGLRRGLTDMHTRYQDIISEALYRLGVTMGHQWELQVSQYNSVVKKLNLLNPVARIQTYKEKTIDLARQIGLGIKHFVALRESRFQAGIEKLSSLSPLNILSRGYSITFHAPEGRSIKEAGEVSVGDTLETRLHKGMLISKVTEVKTNGRDEI